LKDVGGAGGGAGVIVKPGAHQGGVTGERNGGAEPVTSGGVAGRELGLLRPAAARARKDVGGAGVGATHQGGVTGERNGGAELVTSRGVAGRELGLLRPAAARARKDVGGAGGGAGVIIITGTHQGGVTGERNGGAEPVTSSGVAGRELGLLRPAAARARKDVGGAGVGAGVIIITGTHQGGVTGERNGGAELVTSRGVAGRELGLLRPAAARARKDVGGAGGGAGVIVTPGTHQGGVTGERNGVAEPVTSGGVAGRELGLLRPAAARARKDVGGAGGGAGVIVTPGTHQGGVTGERNGGAELVTSRGVAGRELGLLRPAAARARKDVGGAGGGAGVIVKPGAHQGGVTGERNGVAELVTSGGVAGQ